MPISTKSNAETERTISVSGKSKLSLPPDIAKLSFVIQTKNAEISIAQSQNAEFVARVLQVLEQNGIAKKDIKTTYFRVGDWSDYKDKEWVKMGYHVTSSMSFSTREVEKAGKYIDLLIAAGVVEIHDVEFGLADPSAAYERALTVAIADATSKAKHIANQLGATLGKVVSVSENTYFDDDEYIPIRFSAQKMSRSTTETEISEGTTSIPAKVAITFELE